MFSILKEGIKKENPFFFTTFDTYNDDGHLEIMGNEPKISPTLKDGKK